MCARMGWSWRALEATPRDVVMDVYGEITADLPIPETEPDFPDEDD